MQKAPMGAFSITFDMHESVTCLQGPLGCFQWVAIQHRLDCIYRLTVQTDACW